ncbi:hypothetical protein ACFLQ8_02460 [Candidatus Auribacterota bacterium]
MIDMAKTTDWVKENCEKVVFFSVLILYLCILLANAGELFSLLSGSINYFPYSDTSSNKKYYVDFDRVAAIIGEVKNPEDLSALYKRDIFTEYKGALIQVETVQRGGEDKDGARLRLVKIYRQPVKLLFKGYIQLPDGSYSVQINWARKTDFKKVGEKIRGYKIVDFQQRLFEEKSPTGIVKQINKSIVEIRKGENKPIVLEKGKLITEKELFAKLFDKKLFKNVTVHVGSTGDGYKVLDITEDEVILSPPSGDNIHLKIGK